MCRSRGMGYAEERQPSFPLSIQCEETSHSLSLMSHCSVCCVPTDTRTRYWSKLWPGHVCVSTQYSCDPRCLWSEHHWRCCPSPTGLHCSHACLTTHSDIIYKTVMSRYPTRHHLQDINVGMPVMPALRRLRQENWYFRVVLSYITNSRLARVL